MISLKSFSILFYLTLIFSDRVIACPEAFFGDIGETHYDPSAQSKDVTPNSFLTAYQRAFNEFSYQHRNGMGHANDFFELQYSLGFREKLAADLLHDASLSPEQAIDLIFREVVDQRIQEINPFFPLIMLWEYSSKIESGTVSVNTEWKSKFLKRLTHYLNLRVDQTSRDWAMYGAISLGITDDTLQEIANDSYQNPLANDLMIANPETEEIWGKASEEIMEIYLLSRMILKLRDIRSAGFDSGLLLIDLLKKCRQMASSQIAFSSKEFSDAFGRIVLIALARDSVGLSKTEFEKRKDWFEQLIREEQTSGFSSLQSIQSIWLVFGGLEESMSFSSLRLLDMKIRKLSSDIFQDLHTGILRNANFFISINQRENLSSLVGTLSPAFKQLSFVSHIRHRMSQINDSKHGDYLIRQFQIASNRLDMSSERRARLAALVTIVFWLKAIVGDPGDSGWHDDVRIEVETLVFRSIEEIKALKQSDGDANSLTDERSFRSDALLNVFKILAKNPRFVSAKLLRYLNQLEWASLKLTEDRVSEFQTLLSAIRLKSDL